MERKLSPTDSSEETPQKHTILVVDDEASILRSVHRLLRRQYNILTTTSVQEAFDLLEKHPIHLVMSDQRMPTMTGVEFLTFVKECYPECVRILFTGYTDTQSAIEAINSGQVYCYISKPWDPDNLRLMIAQATERYELLRERRHLLEQLQQANESLEKRNRELERANHRLKDLDRLKNVFMELVSHELNTPTAVIQGYSDYLGRELTPQQGSPVARALGAISNHTKRLRSITGRIFKVIESNRPNVEPQREQIAVMEMLDQLRDDVDPFLRKRQQHLHIECSASLEAYIDSSKICDALLQLTMNAIKFSPDGESIYLRAWQQQDKLHLQVEDHGIGVRAEDQKQIFEPFFSTFDNANHSSGDYQFSKRGIGLGLTIVRRFAEMHHGQVSFRPSEPRGATFTIILPVTEALGD
jgi:signal transduction histidine kinase